MKDILWDTKDYKNFCRLNIDDFEHLLSLVDLKIKKQDTAMRDSIPSRTRLAVTLRYLATGDSYRSLEFLTRVSRKTISKFVPEVLNAIIISLSDKYLKMPSSQSEWRNVANDFDNLWQFPHTVGAIEGYHSIFLLAVVDAHSRFIYIDVGGNGRASDVVLLKNSSLYENMKTGRLNLLSDEALPGQLKKTSYFFIGDDIFGIDRNLMKAFGRSSNLSTPEEVFNYRLSRARMTVEMAFGRLASRFRIFHRPIEVELTTCNLVVTASCILHNMLSNSIADRPKLLQEQIIPELPATVRPLPTQQHDTVRFANEMRENVKRYLVTDGDVPFQWQKIKKQIANTVSVTME